jgi:hypothetical protein
MQITVKISHILYYLFTIKTKHKQKENKRTILTHKLE